MNIVQQLGWPIFCIVIQYVAEKYFFQKFCPFFWQSGSYLHTQKLITKVN